MQGRMVIIDLQDGFRRPNAKACPTCGAGASALNVAPSTDQDYRARALVELKKLSREGWALDLEHADTKRFADTVEGKLPVGDVRFAVAMSRATP